MKFFENYKTFIWTWGIVALIIYMIWDSSKTPNFNCDNWANDFKNNFNSNIILTKKTNESGLTTLSGIDLKTKTMVNCEDGSKWINDNFEK